MWKCTDIWGILKFYSRKIWELLMKNIDLFNFKFVDRENERMIVKNFILSPNTDNVLWIHGESGVGKTELAKYFSNHFLSYKYIHINPVKTQTISYFSTLTKELEKEKFSLPNFILKNYREVRDLAKDTISEINVKTKFVSGALEIGEKIFIDVKGEFFSTANVITRYISKLSKNQMYIFIFDNFQQCDLNSLDIIQEICGNLLGTDNIKFIFITTDDIISSDSEIIKFLTEKIPSLPIMIKPFEEKEFFLDILLNIYKLDNITNVELDSLFKVCNGMPEKLKNFLRNMYLSNGIEYDSKGTLARLIPSIFNETLCKGVDNVDLDSLGIIDKLIFKIMISWNEVISIPLLEDIARYIVSEILYFPDELKQEIIKAIHNLLSLNIVELGENGLKIKHDLLYLSYIPKYNVVPEALLYNKLYDYINLNKEKIVETYSQTFFNLNNALYSCCANHTSWVQTNLDCLKMLVAQSDYHNIAIIINRLEKSFTEMCADDLILLAECFYNCGKYERARNILNCSYSKLSNDEEYFRYYYLSGKIYNIILDKNNAEKELLLAKEYILPGTDREILVKHMLQLVIVEVVGRKQEAKEIFCSISEHIEEYNVSSRALGILLKNCSNYYSGKAALSLLEKALSISEANNDLVETAYVKNNMGYEFFKLNNYEECKKLYKESLDILSQTKVHESAYPLSNLAICYMVDNKYNEAISLINRAFYWNCSSYLDIVLNTHLMLCYEQIGKKDESYIIANMLFDKLESGNIKDPVILRKVYLNLAINFDRLDLSQLAKICAKKAYTFSIDSSSEYRASKIYAKYFGPICNEISAIKEQYCTKCYFDHWITIFSHD